MTDINVAIDKLKAVHLKYKIPGGLKSGSSGANKISSDLPTSLDVDAFYQNCEPVDVKIETGFTPLKLFSSELLMKAQVGYRWINTSTGIVINDEWPKDYLIIMDDIGGGKPVIAVTNVEGTPVYASYDVVEPFKVSDSLADFLTALAGLIEVVYGSFNIFDISDDHGISDVFLEALIKVVRPTLGEDDFARFVDYFYG